MPSKLEFYAQMADETAGRLTGSFQNWTAFLTTASRLYKYPFNEQLMIYAQRPEATACAEYDLWNKQMSRYVRRGSRGIALIDANGDRPKLKYVFDVSDTGGGEDSRRLFLWELRPEHTGPVSEALEHRYGITGEYGLADQLERVAAQLAREYWEEHRRDILDIVDGSFLEEYDEFNIGAAFRNAAAVSITYSLLSRCGMAPKEYFQHEDFLSIFDWNTPDTVYALGTAVSQANQEVLRQIGVSIINYEREKNAERRLDNERIDLYPERGLPDPRPETVRDGGETPGQVREDAQEIPPGASPGIVEPPAADGEAVPAPAGNRRDSQPEAGADDAVAGGGGGRDGGAEGGRSDEMDGPDEHLQGAGGGDDPGRAGIQLTIREAPAGGQLSFFPTEAEQIALIDEAERVVKAPFAFSFAQEEIDHFLRIGSNAEHHRLRIVSEFSKGKTVEENAQYLKTLFYGGNGIKTGDKSVSAWYGEDGIRLAKGKSARYSSTAQVIPWQEAAGRIGQLLESGQYAANVELAEAPGHERRSLALSLLYFHHDLSDKARERQYLPTIGLVRGGGYPEEVERLAERLQDAAFRQTLMEEYAAFWTAYRQDRGLMRFHYHKPQQMWDALKDLSLPRNGFSTDMTEVPEPAQFITEDEIDAALAGGGSYEGSHGRIYDYFRETHTPKEKADFLKNEYGTGGRSHALSRAGGSGEDHDGKGIRYQKDGCPEVKLNWNQVVKRIDELIRKGRYMTPEAIAEHEAAKEAKEQQAKAQETVEETVSTPQTIPEQPEVSQSPAFDAYNDIKHAHPEDIVLFQVGDFFEMYGEDARQAAQMLGLNLTTRPIPGAGRVELCGIPAHRLEQYVEQLRDRFDVTISAVTDGERRAYSLRSIDHEAEQAINAHEAEYGADGHRAFPSSAPEQEAAPIHQDAPAPMPRRELTQEDIDEALRRWNGSMESKRAVVRYMAEHAREKDTAAWLAREYGTDPDKPLHVTVTGADAEVEMPWPKVQRRIAQLIQQEKFYTEAEYDRMEDVDPIAIRENLAQRGIVDGQVVDEAALDSDPFIRQAMADAEQAAQEETPTPERPLGPSPTVREIYEHYLPIVRERVLEDQAYRNACANSDKENAYLEGDAAIKRAASTIEDASFINLYYGLGGFHNNLRRDILDETYPVLSAAAEEPAPRYKVTVTSDAFPEPEDAFAVWDNENEDYYILSNGTVPTFPTEQEAEDYLRQLQPEQAAPEMEAADAPASQRDPLAPAYAVGDTVYLDNTAFQITEVGDFNVQLRDPALTYPIFRAESKTRFEAMLY